MKRLISRSALFVVMAVMAIVLSMAPSAVAQQPPTCTGGAALSGWYGMLVGSYSGSGGKYLVGALNFNGACGITGTNTFGGIGGNFAQASVTGTYGSNGDGTYNVTLNLSGQSTPQTYIVGVSQSGNEAVGIETDGASAFIDLQSQFLSAAGGFTTASLTGTYAVACVGSGTDLNYQTFDGQGNITGVDSEYNTGAVTTNTPYTGSYTVNSDGTFQGSVLFGGGTVPFYGVLDNGNNEVEYIYENTGFGGVNSCSGKKSTGTTLSGSYGILVAGPATTGEGEQFLSGVLNFNGGSLSGEVNGGLNSVYTNSQVTGSYVVNGNSTVTITMDLAGQSSAETFNVGVSEGGNEADGIETDDLAEATVDLQSQVLANGQTYSNSSLSGTYAVLCSNTGQLGLNYVTFDGLGDITAIALAYSNNGSYEGDFGTTGSYAVNSDGTFSGSLAGSFAQYSVTGVIENDTAEISFTYEEGGGGNQACSGVSTYGPIGTATVVATPTFSPAPGAYGSAQPVSLFDTTSGAVIHYTTNGTPPTPNSPVYGTPIPVSATTSIQAIAVLAGDNNSAIASGTYFINTLPTAVTPIFNPLPGTYSSTQTVMLSDTTPGAVIHCTTNGSPVSPTSPVCTTLTVSSTTTIQAIAVATGYNNSPVTTGTYTIQASGSGTSVNLANYFNIYGIATVGNPPRNGGFDNDSYAYNSSLLGTSLSYAGHQLYLGCSECAGRHHRSDRSPSRRIVRPDFPLGRRGQWLADQSVRGGHLHGRQQQHLQPELQRLGYAKEFYGRDHRRADGEPHLDQWTDTESRGERLRLYFQSYGRQNRGQRKVALQPQCGLPGYWLGRHGYDADGGYSHLQPESRNLHRPANGHLVRHHFWRSDSLHHERNHGHCDFSGVHHAHPECNHHDPGYRGSDRL
jgi:hypothetical protein